jgi:hypothetical protein
MNFFESIATLDFTGEVRITITKTTPDHLAVSFFLAGKKGSDEATKMLKPLIVRGTGNELDANYIKSVLHPLQVTAEFYSNSDAYLKTLQEAKNQSAVGKANPKSDKEKKYDALMKKADELEKEGKLREAWMKVPEVTDYPEKKEELIARRKSLSDQWEAKESDNTLFAPPQTLNNESHDDN